MQRQKWTQMIVNLTIGCFRHSTLTKLADSILAKLSKSTIQFYNNVNMTFLENVSMFFGIFGTYLYLEKLLVINKHEMPITSQK